MSVLLLNSKLDLEANKKIFEDFDPEYAGAVVQHIMELINEVYFRIKFVGFDHPILRNNPDAPVILISNHSGRAIPWDAVSFMSGLLKKFDFDHTKVCRTLIVPTLSKLGVMTPYFLTNFWKRCGGVDASFFNFETMMQHPNANVMLYPEGVPGIGKGFNHRYELQQFSTSFVRMALKYDTDIVPFATVNAEYINPYMYNVPALNKIVHRLTSIPFLPVGVLTIMLLLQPWFYYLAFPAKITFVKGKRIRRKELTSKRYEELNQAEVEAIRDKVQAIAQEELTTAVEEHGKKPFDWKEFFKVSWANRKYFPYFLPFGWPFLFSEFHLKWQKGEPVKMKFGFWSMIRLIWQRPLILCYFIPIIGWLPIIYLSMKNKHLEGK